jgi:glycosyltransferase involved in cell wall biosynthesis
MSARRKIHIVQVFSLPVRWGHFEWLARDLDRSRFDLSFILLNAESPPMAPVLQAHGVPVFHVPHPGVAALAGTVRAIAGLCRSRAVDLVHVHLMSSTLPGLLGACRAGIRIRLQTRHHAGPLPRSYRPWWWTWLDRWSNRLSTTIIAPSEQARRALLDHDRVPAGKVVVIPHGFDLRALRRATEADALQMRAKHRFGDDAPIIGVVSRYVAIKGITYIVPAFRRLLQRYPRARLVLAGARGRQHDAIRALLSTLPPDRYTEILFEEDMPSLFKTFDVFVHAPVHPRMEAFGQVYVEAMAAGVPCVCTAAGIGCEYLVDGANAIVVGYQDSDAIHDGIVKVLGDPALRQRITARAWHDIQERFDLRRMLDSLENLYLRLFETQETLK